MSETGERRESHEGGCLCGAVRYRAEGRLYPVVNCHCGQCRRTHGHFAGYTGVPSERFTVLESRGLKWYRASDKARRGFCQECGASLFWAPEHGRHISIAAGTLDAPTGLKTVGHIYVAHKGDYYDLEDGLPQYPDGWERNRAEI